MASGRAKESRNASESELALPHNLDAERAVIGAVLLDNAALRPAIAHLERGDFFLEAHRRLFTCIVKLSEENRPIDLVTLHDDLEREGKLEAAGGSAYLSSLVDGVPQVSNVDCYARIVKEKALLRRYGSALAGLSNTALSGRTGVDEVRGRVRQLLDSPSFQSTHGLVAVNAEELLSLRFPPSEMVVAPILPSQGMMMVYSKRGVGKTYLALKIADAVSSGQPCLCWSVPKPRRVLLVDGELPATTLQDRLARIIAAEDCKVERDPSWFRIVTSDLQRESFPDLARREGQSLVEDALGDTELLVLDSLSTLCRAGKENEGESWLPVQEWALKLRRHGVSVLFVHHAGKAGWQRGTSRREDVLDTVLALRHPTDYSPVEGLRFEVHCEKARGFFGEDAKPFEVRLQQDEQGRSLWTVRPVEDVTEVRAAELFQEGLSVRDVAEELGISKSRAHRLRKRVGKKMAAG